MVDFNELLTSRKTVEPINPVAIFESLPKSSGISDLHNTQAEILYKWYEKLRDKPDVVIELNTGGGKTLVGLLVALSTMRETKLGVLYLVADKQLVMQVVNQAMMLNIPAKPYKSRSSLDADFDNGKSILVASYQALFNGKSVFGIRGSNEIVELGGIVVDDAHASLSAVQRTFSLSVPFDAPNNLYGKSVSEFRDSFDRRDLSGTYEEYVRGERKEVTEIPFWDWHAAMSHVSRVVSQASDSLRYEDNEFANNLKFAWPLLKDNLKYCHAMIGPHGFTIAAVYPFIHMIPSFKKAQRRIYMSATITDYGDMIRTFDLRGLSSETVIAPKTVSGIGRRMMLPLKKEDAESEVFRELIKKEVSQGHGVVRLVPYQNTSQESSALGFYEPAGSENVSDAVATLRLSQAEAPVSFVNRYNGIDLPDGACRILIMSSLPIGATDYEVLISTYLNKSKITTQRIAQSIEQGAGRGVRGASDHCVVLFEDARLIDWLDHDRNRERFSPAFIAQLDIGKELMSQISTASELCEAIRQDLNSDDGWKKYHASYLANAVQEDKRDRFGASYSMARVERRAFSLWVEHEYAKACDKLQKVAESLGDDPQYRGWLLHLAARITYDGDNLELADELQRKAHAHIQNLPYIKAGFESLEKIPEWAMMQANNIIEVIDGIGMPREVTRVFDKMTANCNPLSSAHEFEEGIKLLGKFLGFESERADVDGYGSDVYWITSDNFGFAIEAKNEKQPDAPFHKKDASQLRTASDWLKQQHPDIDVIAVSVHWNCEADKNASASNLMVLTMDELSKLIDSARTAMEKSAQYHGHGDRAERIAREIARLDLGGRGIKRKYLRYFDEVDRQS